MDLINRSFLSPECEQDFEKLISRVSNGHCCAFLGAGLSKDANYPSGPDLKELMIKKAKEKGIPDIVLDINDFYKNQMEVIRNAMDEENYWDALFSIFGPENKWGFLTVHLEISRIPFVGYITTNYDMCLEHAFASDNVKVVVQYFPELDLIRLKEKSIYHIHGVIKQDDIPLAKVSTRLSKRDYDEAYLELHAKLPRFLGELSENYSLLFMGYSLSDEDLNQVIHTTQLVLEQRNKNEVLNGLGRRILIDHYIILHPQFSVNTVALNALGLKPIFLNKQIDPILAMQQCLSYIRFRTTQVSYPEPEINRAMFEDFTHE